MSECLHWDGLARELLCDTICVTGDNLRHIGQEWQERAGQGIRELDEVASWHESCLYIGAESSVAAEETEMNLNLADKRSKTARVAAVLAMSKARGKPVSRECARQAVAWRMAMEKDAAHANLFNGPKVARATVASWYRRIDLSNSNTQSKE